MGLVSWFKRIFGHFKPTDYITALEVAKSNIDGIAGVEGWAWKQQFDDSTNQAIAELQAWQPGSPATDVVMALNNVLSIVEQNTNALDKKDQAVIAVFVSTAETVLTLLGH